MALAFAEGAILKASDGTKEAELIEIQETESEAIGGISYMTGTGDGFRVRAVLLLPCRITGWIGPPPCSQQLYIILCAARRRRALTGDYGEPVKSLRDQLAENKAKLEEVRRMYWHVTLAVPH